MGGRHLPAVIITAHDEPAVRAESERLASSSYLPKPFSGHALLAAVDQALRPH
jgi:CheY-like chemotaxis protein